MDGASGILGNWLTKRGIQLVCYNSCNVIWDLILVYQETINTWVGLTGLWLLTFIGCKTRRDKSDKYIGEFAKFILG